MKSFLQLPQNPQFHEKRTQLQLLADDFWKDFSE